MSDYLSSIRQACDNCTSFHTSCDRTSRSVQIIPRWTLVSQLFVSVRTLLICISKLPVQSTKQRTLSKLILSFFYNIMHIIGQLSDPTTIRLALSASARLLPYVLTSRKAAKTYLKASNNVPKEEHTCLYLLQTCLELWSSGEDDVKLAAVLSIRRMVLCKDNSMLDSVMKVRSLAFIRRNSNMNPALRGYIRLCFVQLKTLPCIRCLESI
jgi:hypothetical protein